MILGTSFKMENLFLRCFIHSIKYCIQIALFIVNSVMCQIIWQSSNYIAGFELTYYSIL